MGCHCELLYRYVAAAPAMPPQTGEPWAQATVAKESGLEREAIEDSTHPPHPPEYPQTLAGLPLLPTFRTCLEAGLTSCPRWSVPART